MCCVFSAPEYPTHPHPGRRPAKDSDVCFLSKKDLFKMPIIPHPPLSAPDTTSNLVYEFQAPQANRLVGDLDSSRREHLLKITETQAKAVAKPDGMGNDLNRESMPRKRRFLFSHQLSLPASKPSRYTGFNNMTVPSKARGVVSSMLANRTGNCQFICKSLRNLLHEKRSENSKSLSSLAKVQSYYSDRSRLRGFPKSLSGQPLVKCKEFYN